MCRMRSCVIAARLTTIVALFFLLFGLIVPLWAPVVSVTDSNGDTTTTFGGLWFVVICMPTCEVISTFTGLSSLTVSIWILIAPILAGTVLALIGTLIVVCSCCSREPSKACHIFACVLFWLAGLIVGGLVLWLSPGYAILSHVAGPAYFPWSYFCTGIGALFALISAICLVSALCNWSRYDDYIDDGYGRQIPLQQHQPQGQTNVGYIKAEGHTQNMQDSPGKNVSNQEYLAYDRQRYDHVVQPPSYNQRY